MSKFSKTNPTLDRKILGKEKRLEEKVIRMKRIIIILSAILSVSIIYILYINLIPEKSKAKNRSYPVQSSNDYAIDSPKVDESMVIAQSPNDVQQQTQQPQPTQQSATNNKVQKTQPENNKVEELGSTSAAEISFETIVYDYGNIAKESDGKCSFSFINTGKEPLVLSNAKASCGCTVPSWPKDPIMPGGSGVISVVYDTKKTGPFNKTITIMSNANNSSVVLTIKGNVTE